MMKKILLLVIVGLLCVSAHAGLSYVGLLDAATTYTVNDGKFEINDSGLIIIAKYDDAPQSLVSMNATFILNSIYDSGMNFSGGTLLLTDNTGTLLSGNMISLVFDLTASGNLEGTGTAVLSESTIDGFPTGPASVLTLSFDLDPEFSDFGRQDYSGRQK